MPSISPPDPCTLPSRREIARYIEPFLDFYPQGVNLSKPTNFQKPIQTPDRNLNALCQLGVLRTDCKRALVSLVGQENEYILSETSASARLSKSYDSMNADENWWLGLSILPTPQCFCPWTVSQSRTLAEGHPSSENLYDHRLTPFVVKDTLKDSFFSTLNLVTGFPHVRFYVGIPLISSEGACIGSYFLLDDKPHDDGLGEDDMERLQDIAALIVDHLELLRSKINLLRSQSMISGMADFMKDRSNLRHRQTRPEKHKLSAKRVKTFDVSPDESMSSANSHNWSGPSKETSSSSATSPTSSTADLPSGGLASRHGATKDVLQKASRIMLDATQLEMVVFVDTRFYPSQNSHTNDTSGGDSTSGYESQTSSCSESKPSAEPVSSSDCCNILGLVTVSSTSTKSAKPVAPRINSKLLQTMLRRYPYGESFVLDESEPDSSSESDEILYQASRGRDLNGSSKPPQRHRRYSRRAELKYLRAAFPQYRNLLFLPLWDSQKERWFAATFAGTSHIARDLTTNEELDYIAAFGDLIVAEVSRIDTMRADQAKADFISSISHEFRSPLHGVLGSLELLRQKSRGNLEDNHIHDIEIAGRTLLDTVDHLLDYSKINSSRRSSFPLSGQAADTRHGDFIDLEILAEEVFQTVALGYEHANKIASNRKLSLVIENLTPNLSLVKADSGALRRILMNLCGNSLKYTESGMILLKIQQENSGSETSESSLISISVTDTGRGMSQSFQEDYLFTPFKQENPYSPGAGLGLSIVKKIVTTLKGAISVQSVVGQGTTIKTTFNFARQDVSASDEISVGMNLVEDARRVSSGLKFCIFQFTSKFTGTSKDSVSSKATRKGQMVQARSLRAMCSKAFGMSSVSDLNESPDIVVLLPNPDEPLEDSTQDLALLKRPAIIVCSTSAMATQYLSFGNGQKFVPVVQPIGVQRLARAILEASALPDVAFAPLSGPANDKTLVDVGTNSKDIAKREDQNEALTKISMPIRPPLISAKSRDFSIDFRILIVDDNAINVRLLETFAKRQKLEYKSACNGLEALELYKQSVRNGTPFSVIMMDIQMPVMDGLESTREIRNFEQSFYGRSECHVIALTGLASLLDQEEIMACGIDMYVAKPVRLKQLHRILLDLQKPAAC